MIGLHLSRDYMEQTTTASLKFSVDQISYSYLKGAEGDFLVMLTVKDLL